MAVSSQTHGALVRQLRYLMREILSLFYRGQQESPSKTLLPAYDPECYLCPGNKRAQGDTNPKYDSTFVFVNDYSAVKEEQAAYEGGGEDGSFSISRWS